MIHVYLYTKNNWQTRVFSRNDEVFGSVVVIIFQSVFLLRNELKYFFNLFLTSTHQNNLKT
jgi:hypothetical protein